MDILNLAISTVPISQNVEYSCTLFNNWSGSNHPIGYDSVAESAHWSPPVLLSHHKFAELWSNGEMASPGIESVAETGSTTILQSEIEVLKTQGLVGDMVIGSAQFNARDPPQTLESIKIGPSVPYLSAVSMMAPSPDWFSGFSSFSPRGPGGLWYETFELLTYPFDAGTEQGDTYSINNDPESPHGPIFPLTKDTVPDSGILLGPKRQTVMPVLAWRCSLKDIATMFDATMKDDAALKNDDAMMKDDVAMKNDDAMMKDDTTMKNDDATMKNDDTTMFEESNLDGMIMMANGGLRGLRGDDN